MPVTNIGNGHYNHSATPLDKQTVQISHPGATVDEILRLTERFGRGHASWKVMHDNAWTVVTVTNAVTIG